MATIVFTGPSVTDPTVTASKTLTVPDALMTTVLAAICAQSGYQAEVDDPDNPGQKMANPIGPATFAVKKSLEHWISIALSYAQTQAAESAAAAAAAAAAAPIQAAFAEATIA